MDIVHTRVLLAFSENLKQIAIFQKMKNPEPRIFASKKTGADYLPNQQAWLSRTSTSLKVRKQRCASQKVPRITSFGAFDACSRLHDLFLFVRRRGGLERVHEVK